ncbi:HupE/UreJ family protein [Rhodovibrionaceae bacterium A322]
MARAAFSLLTLLSLIFGLWLAVPPASLAHTLGVDRAELLETTPGSYRLTSKVPRKLAAAILPPLLPDHCDFSGDPNGTRGAYAVVFTFTCSPALLAGDKLLLPWKREGALLTVTWDGQAPVTGLVKREGLVLEVALENWQAGSGSFWQAAKRYSLLGVEHILIGIDHLLFVLALLFVVSGFWKLAKTITAFTLAHSITLGLATLGYVSLPSAPVEAAIALSIVFLASEIIWRARGRQSLTYQAPWLVAFAFGLLHGLGFAGALADIGLPAPEIPVALLFFNIGVELGQLLFVAAALLLGWLIARLPLPARGLSNARLTLVYGIGTLASYWVIERALQIFV